MLKRCVFMKNENFERLNINECRYLNATHQKSIFKKKRKKNTE